MRLLNKTTLGAVLGAGALALSTASISAAIACRGNVCWHTQGRYEYPREARIVIRPDDWRWRRHERYSGANTKAEDTGAVGVGLNGEQ